MAANPPEDETLGDENEDYEDEEEYEEEEEEEEEEIIPDPIPDTPPLPSFLPVDLRAWMVRHIACMHSSRDVYSVLRSMPYLLILKLIFTLLLFHFIPVVAHPHASCCCDTHP